MEAIKDVKQKSESIHYARIGFPPTMTTQKMSNYRLRGLSTLSISKGR